MNPKANLQNQLEIIQAASDGRRVQFRSGGNWEDVTDQHVFDFKSNEYLVARVMKHRPWTYEEIPLGAILKHKTKNRAYMLTAKCVNDSGQHIVWAGHEWVGVGDILENFTIDGKVCGVEV